MEYFECVPDIVTSTTTAAAVWFEIMYLLRSKHLIVILRVSYLVIFSVIITTATAAVLFTQSPEIDRNMLILAATTTAGGVS